jgi:alpha/beta hydrolase fold
MVKMTRRHLMVSAARASAFLGLGTSLQFSHAQRARELPPLPPFPICPISWHPNALAPVFFGVRDYYPRNSPPRFPFRLRPWHGSPPPIVPTVEVAPVKLRVFFPSLDGSPFSAAILRDCGKYPLILFAHGHCNSDVDHYKRWFYIPSLLARAGNVVVVPHLPGVSGGGVLTDIPIVATVLSWMRDVWSERDVLVPAPVTGILGHSFGAMLTGAIAQAGEIPVAAYASLSGEWEHEWPGQPPPPIQDLKIPKLFVWGTNEPFAGLSDRMWSSLPLSKHRAIFANTKHWDYLWNGPAPTSQPNLPCSNDGFGPCGYFSLAVADLVTMFFARYLATEFAPDVPARIPRTLRPPPLVGLTPEQQFYAGSYLVGMALIAGTQCEPRLDAATLTDRIVPYVLNSPAAVAARDVRRVGLVPQFLDPQRTNSWVSSQSPQAGSRVDPGSTVKMRLRVGPTP